MRNNYIHKTTQLSSSKSMVGCQLFEFCQVSNVCVELSLVKLLGGLGGGEGLV